MQGRQVFREEILNEIREQIFSGELKPGDKIVETFWAKKMGVSQAPVREAIRDLEALGLVETVPFKGSRVRELSVKDIRDNYGVRMCLESKSIQDAMRELDDAQLKELAKTLQGYVKEMDVAAKDANLLAFTDADTNFHKAIIGATGNDVLLKLWTECNMRNWTTVETLKNPKALKNLQSQHKRILESIKDRECDVALAILNNHITALMNSYIDASR